MKKGRPILIEGRLKLDQWEDKQTDQKRSSLGVVMEAFQFLGSAPWRDGGGGEFCSASVRQRLPPAAATCSRARMAAHRKKTTFHFNQISILILGNLNGHKFLWQKLKLF